jgi:hypothetical protein
MARELERLVRREGFLLHAGSWGEEPALFSKTNYPGPTALRRVLEAAPKNHWAGLQVYYRMSETDVQRATGLDLVEAMMAVYREVLPIMNLCMQVQLVDQHLASSEAAAPARALNPAIHPRGRTWGTR